MKGRSKDRPFVFFGRGGIRSASGAARRYLSDLGLTRSFPASAIFRVVDRSEERLLGRCPTELGKMMGKDRGLSCPRGLDQRQALILRQLTARHTSLHSRFTLASPRRWKLVNPNRCLTIAKWASLMLRWRYNA